MFGFLFLFHRISKFSFWLKAILPLFCQVLHIFWLHFASLDSFLPSMISKTLRSITLTLRKAIEFLMF